MTEARNRTDRLVTSIQISVGKLDMSGFTRGRVDPKHGAKATTSGLQNIVSV